MERVSRRWWARVVTVVASLVILGALLSGAFQLAVLMVPRLSNDISAYVEKVAERQVDIGGVSLVWRRMSPRLTLSDITVYADDGLSPALSARRLHLDFEWARLLRGSRLPSRVGVDGVQLVVSRNEQGVFSIRGLDSAGGQASGEDWTSLMERFDQLTFKNSELRLEDAQLNSDPGAFQLLEAQLHRTERGLAASVELLLPPNMGQSIQVDGEILGDLSEADEWRGQWRMQVRKLRNLPWLDALLRPGGRIDFAGTELHLSAELLGMQLQEIDAEVSADLIRGRLAEQTHRLRNLNLRTAVTRGAEGWRIALRNLSAQGVNGFWPQTGGHAEFRQNDDGSREFALSLDHLMLADMVAWLGLFPSGLPPQAQALSAGLQGKVQGLVLRSRLHDNRLRFNAKAGLQQVALRSQTDGPSFEGLQAQLWLSETGGRLKFADQAIQLEYARLFDQALLLEQIGGELAWSQTADEVELSSSDLSWRGLGTQGTAQVNLDLPRDERSPRLSLRADFKAEDATRLKPWMPKVWHPKLRSWLGRAVQGGRVEAGSVVVDGALAHFPFVEHPGRFDIDLDVRNGRLDYHRQWPAVERANARIAIDGGGIRVESRSAKVGGLSVKSGTADLVDFKQRQLRIRGAVSGQAEQYYRVLPETPLAKRLRFLSDQTSATGTVRTTLELNVPLRTPKQTRVQGQIHLQDTALRITGLGAPIEKIRGTIAFDRKSLSADALTGELYQTPIRASILSLSEGALLRASFDWNAEQGADGLGRFIPANLRSGLSGSSRWRASLPLQGKVRPQLRLQSDLVGLSAKLPLPLEKAADEAWNTDLRLRFEDEFPLRVNLEVAERIGLDLAFSRLAASPLKLRRALIRLGPGAAPVASEDGLVITGTVPELDIWRWGQLLPAGGGDAAMQTRLDLNAGRVHLGGPMVEGVRMSWTPQPGGWFAQLRGNGAEGVIGFRRDQRAGVLSARLQRLHLAAQGRSNGRQQSQAPASAVDPGKLPLLDVEVEQLRMGAAQLGKLELRTQAVAGGQRIDHFAAGGKGTEISLQGWWQRRDQRSSAELAFDAQTDNIDAILQTLGYVPNLSSQKSAFSGQIRWPQDVPGAEHGLNWRHASGEIKLRFDDGKLRAVEPGAGRVLGLINFYALPRRLALDFGDVLSKGLSFDRIKGDFLLAQGTATTDNLDIVGPSLRMELRGDVGLADRSYDQEVAVYPDVSSGVTLGALLLGGPAAGALALIAQEVLDKPLDQATQLRYKVTGKWEDPQVERSLAILETPRSTRKPQVGRP